MSDPSPPADLLMDLADALVTALATAFPSITFDGQTLPVTVQWTEDANVDLSDDVLKAPLVWVLDASDSARSEHSEAFEDYDLLVIVQMKIPQNCDTGAFARAMSALSAAIRAWARGPNSNAELAIDNEGFPCLEARRPVARNHDEWHHRRRFFSEILTKWRRY